ncbi:MAG: hypothetical protein IJ905_03650 [Fibrobacter sp.]|nr:hypothetical protein [Fibrobacter sp.]
MNSELHLFIIWEKGRAKEKEILDDIGSRLEILSKKYITWSKDKFTENLTRFYGKNLPSSSDKIKECGTGEFLLIVVRDNNPVYCPRKTSKGVKNVNVNIFDAKELYRFWTGGGSKIHATNSLAEVNHDMTLLLGMNAYDFEKNNTMCACSKEQRDLVGANYWNSFSEFLYVLNNCVEYVILRNYEGLPEQITIGSHGDVDFLTPDRKQFEMVANSRPVFKQKYRVRETIQMREGAVFCDVRFFGDGYYDSLWEQNIIATRVFCEKEFYVPNNVNLAYSLLYHAFIQKNVVAEDYKIKLKKYVALVNQNESSTYETFDNRAYWLSYLCNFLNKNSYLITEPTDLSVTFNLNGASEKESFQHYSKRFCYKLMRKIKLV